MTTYLATQIGYALCTSHVRTTAENEIILELAFRNVGRCVAGFYFWHLDRLGRFNLLTFFFLVTGRVRALKRSLKQLG